MVTLGLRLSTFECLYDQKCLDTLAALINFSTPIMALNSSNSIRYPSNTTLIGSIIDNLFIEAWYNTSNYSSYFSECAPATCQYSYVERNDVIYMLTILLGLYGGLTIALRLIVWYGVGVIHQMLTRYRRSVQVSSNTAIEWNFIHNYQIMSTCFISTELTFTAYSKTLSNSTH